MFFFFNYLNGTEHFKLLFFLNSEVDPLLENIWLVCFFEWQSNSQKI